MEIKKTPKADLENKKSTWLLVGYVIVLAFMFVAFEWTKRDIKIDTSQAITDLVFEEEIIPITEQPEQVAPPPPEAPSIAETLTIVDDDADVEETTIATSEETNQAEQIHHGLQMFGRTLRHKLISQHQHCVTRKDSRIIIPYLMHRFFSAAFIGTVHQVVMQQCINYDRPRCLLPVRIPV